MSRIHEALKRAAQERSTQLAAGIEAQVAEVTGESPRPETVVASVPRPASPSRVVAAAASKVVVASGYEELIARCCHPEWRLDPLNSVFQNPNIGQGVSERFRALRSRLYQIAGVRTLRRLLVTSSVAGEGKTFVSTNLAQSIVQQPDMRVLLVDADIRASRLHSTLGAPNRPGLSDYLRGEADEFEVIQKGMEENLCLIPGGSQVSNPSELLLSDRMKHLLEFVTPIFDWVIIDSPPSMPVPDASILGGLVDGILLVVHAGSTHVAIAEKTAAEFRGNNLLGVVLNRVERSESYGDYYYNYQAKRD
jgi:capsular exopolysaccharide synthesis family protein